MYLATDYSVTKVQRPVAGGGGAAGLPVDEVPVGFVPGLSCGGTGFTDGAAGTDGAALSSTWRRVTTPESTVFC